MLTAALLALLMPTDGGAGHERGAAVAHAPGVLVAPSADGSRRQSAASARQNAQAAAAARRVRPAAGRLTVACRAQVGEEVAPTPVASAADAESSDGLMPGLLGASTGSESEPEGVARRAKWWGPSAVQPARGAGQRAEWGGALMLDAVLDAADRSRKAPAAQRDAAFLAPLYHPDATASSVDQQQPPPKPPPPSPPPSAGEGSDTDSRSDDDAAADDSDDGGGEGAAAGPRRRRPSLEPRGRERRAGEQRDAHADVTVAFVHELYASPRFAMLEPAVRFEQLMAITTHFLDHVVTHDGALPTDSRGAPFVKQGGRSSARSFPTAITTIGHKPARGGACDPNWGRKPSARLGDPVPNRALPTGSTDTVVITPGVRRVTTGGHPDALLQLELYEEAVLFFGELLGALEDDERAQRLLQELNRLRTRVGRDMAALPTPTRLADVKFWRKLTMRLLRSPHLTAELRGVLGALETVCGRLLAASPGDQLGAEHDLAQLAEALEEAPVVATWQQMGWLLKPDRGSALGRLRRDQRPTRAARRATTARKGVRRKPAAKVSFADEQVGEAESGRGGSRSDGRSGAGSSGAGSSGAGSSGAGSSGGAGSSSAGAGPSSAAGDGGGGSGSDDDAAPELTRWRPIEQLVSAADMVDGGDASQPSQPTQPTQPVGNLGLLATMGSLAAGAPARVLPRGVNVGGCGGSSSTVGGSNVSGGDGGDVNGRGDAAAPLRFCAYCQRANDLPLFRCRRCGDAACHRSCCEAALEQRAAASVNGELRQLAAGVHLCPACLDAVADAFSQEAAPPPAALLHSIERLTSEVPLLRRLQMAQRGKEVAAVVVEQHARALEGLAEAGGCQVDAAPMRFRLVMLAAAERLRGAVPDVDGALATASEAAATAQDSMMVDGAADDDDADLVDELHDGSL